MEKIPKNQNANQSLENSQKMLSGMYSTQGRVTQANISLVWARKENFLVLFFMVGFSFLLVLLLVVNFMSYINFLTATDFSSALCPKKNRKNVLNCAFLNFLSIVKFCKSKGAI